MGALCVVVVAAASDLFAGMADRAEPVQVQAFVPQLAVEGLHEAFWTGLPGSMNRRRTPVRSDQSNMALLVPSGVSTQRNLLRLSR